jgi:predicted small secreted protein
MRLLIVPAVLSLGLAACNTMAGLGEDMQQAGSSLQRRATEAQGSHAPDNAAPGFYNTPETVVPPPPPPYNPDE